MVLLLLVNEFIKKGNQSNVESILHTQYTVEDDDFPGLYIYIYIYVFYLVMITPEFVT